MEDRKETVLGEVNAYQDLGRWQEDAGQNQKGLRHHRSAQGQIETKDHELKTGRARHAARSPRGVEPNLLRMLAADARFLLRAEHERRRLESDARQIRRAFSFRESS